MIYENLVNRLRKAAGPAIDFPDTLYDEAADAIEKLTEVIRNHDFLESLIKPRWIPVTERLPKGWRSVLVHCAAGEARWIQIADVVRGKWRLLPGYADAKVTHWMPLPEPPKEEE